MKNRLDTETAAAAVVLLGCALTVITVGVALGVLVAKAISRLWGWL